MEAGVVISNLPSGSSLHSSSHGSKIQHRIKNKFELPDQLLFTNYLRVLVRQNSS